MFSLLARSMVPRVVYITSRGHSGSTLLSLLLSGHSAVVSAGELKMLVNPDPQRRLCSCHRLEPGRCPFWSDVQRRVMVSTGVPLDQLVLGEDGSEVDFREHNQALFEAIAAVSGASVIVDSSKSLPRLARLLDAQVQGGVFQIHPVHLHRGPLGTINSARKRGDVLRQAAYNYNRLFFLTRDLLDGVDAPLLFYERLAANPRQFMRHLMAWLKLPLEEQQFHWRDGIRRDIHGNEMRFGSSDKIRLDRSWIRQMSFRDILRVSAWTLPVRFRSKDLFDRMWRWIKLDKGPPIRLSR